MASSHDVEAATTAGLPQRVRRLLDFVTPASRDEDVRRRAFLLTVILGAVLGLAFTCTAIMLSDTLRLGDAYRGVPWWIAGVVMVFCTGLLMLVRKGWVRTASVLLFGIFAVPTFYSSYVWGVDLPQALLGDAFLILLAGALLGTRFAFVFSFFLAAVILAFTMLDANAVVAANRYWRHDAFSVTDGVAIVVTLLVIAIMSWLSNREIDKSLRRAWASEEALKQERDLLEVRVEERTHALRRMQLEKMVQMHRFVEIGKMSSGFFHDLANPLTALSVNLSLLEQHNEQSDAMRAKVKSALVTMDRIQAFLHGVRRQLQAQEVSVRFSATEEIRTVVDILRYKSIKHQVTVETSMPDQLFLQGNPIKFHQVVANLVSNAIDAFTPDSTSRAVHITLRRGGDGVTLTVRDTASGIAPEHLPHIFDAFFTTKDPEIGIGIGLSTCKSIVEDDFGGTITCNTEVGKGTQFTVMIPKARTYVRAARASE